MAKAVKAYRKRQKDDQWFETFRLAFIACGNLNSSVTYKKQLLDREYRCSLIATHIESLRPN